MFLSLFEGEKARTRPTSILVGTVINNINLEDPTLVRVRLAAIDKEIWARLCGPGGGNNAGLFYMPRIDDEVLVAMNENNPDDAFVIGGLWSSMAPAPVDLEQQTNQRSFVTGLTDIAGHSVVFDDAKGSITIKTALPTVNQVTLDSTGITISTMGSTVQVAMSTDGGLTISAQQSINLQAPEINLNATKLTLVGSTQTTISGGMVNIN